MWEITPSQHIFMKDVSCLTNLISFYYQMISLVDEGKPVEIVHLVFSKAFDVILQYSPEKTGSP